MGVEKSKYTLEVRLRPDEILDFDQEHFIFRLRKLVPEAKYYINEEGNPTHNAGYWENCVDDLKPFSLLYPRVLMVIHVEYDYDGTHHERYYIEDGKSVTHSPVLSWPEFDERQLR